MILGLYRDYIKILGLYRDYINFFIRNSQLQLSRSTLKRHASRGNHTAGGQSDDPHLEAMVPFYGVP